MSRRRSGFDPFDQPNGDRQSVEVICEEREPSRPLLYDASGRPLMAARPSRVAGFRHGDAQRADRK